jgi:hypothetical protein
MSGNSREPGRSVRYENEAKRVRDGLITKLTEIRATFNTKIHAINAEVRAENLLVMQQEQQQQQPARNLPHADNVAEQARLSVGGFRIEASPSGSANSFGSSSLQVIDLFKD